MFLFNHSTFFIMCITAFPIIETINSDITEFIATNVISITDGQLYTNRKLFLDGIRPAIDSALSVSRIGSNAQMKLIKVLSAGIKNELTNLRISKDLDTNSILNTAKLISLESLFSQVFLCTNSIEITMLFLLGYKLNDFISGINEIISTMVKFLGNLSSLFFSYILFLSKQNYSIQIFNFLKAFYILLSNNNFFCAQNYLIVLIFILNSQYYGNKIFYAEVNDLNGNNNIGRDNNVGYLNTMDLNNYYYSFFYKLYSFYNLFKLILLNFQHNEWICFFGFFYLTSIFVYPFLLLLAKSFHDLSNEAKLSVFGFHLTLLIAAIGAFANCFSNTNIPLEIALSNPILCTQIMLALLVCLVIGFIFFLVLLMVNRYKLFIVNIIILITFFLISAIVGSFIISYLIVLNTPISIFSAILCTIILFLDLQVKWHLFKTIK